MIIKISEAGVAECGQYHLQLVPVDQPPNHPPSQHQPWSQEEKDKLIEIYKRNQKNNVKNVLQKTREELSKVFGKQYNYQTCKKYVRAKPPKPDVQMTTAEIESEMTKLQTKMEAIQVQLKDAINTNTEANKSLRIGNQEIVELREKVRGCIKGDSTQRAYFCTKRDTNF